MKSTTALEKVKERILEFLAVRQLVKNPKGSILCLRRTSGRGQDFAGDVPSGHATGRKFVPRIPRRRAR